MNSHSFKTLLDRWQLHRQAQQEHSECQVRLPTTDLIKLEALAETFQLERDQILASLLHQAIIEVEEKMPYIPGPNVIRVEEGEEIYEDIGPMPQYLAAQKKAQREKQQD